MSSSSTTLLVSLLSLLSVSQPPTSLTLPIHPQTPAVVKQKTRDIFLRILSVYLNGLDNPIDDTCPKLKVLNPHDYPTPSQEKAFIGVAASCLTDFRREILNLNGIDKAWWLELKVGIRKSDLSEAAGTRYEHILLTLACQAVYWNLLKTLQSRPELAAGHILNFSCEGQKERIDRLFGDLKKVSNSIQTLQKEPMQRIRRLEERRKTLLRVQASMAKLEVSATGRKKASSEELLASLDAKIVEWDDLVRQWLEMDGTVHSESPSKLLDPALVELALEKSFGESHSTAEEKGAVGSSSIQEFITNFDGLEASFPQITSFVDAQLLSASTSHSKIISRLTSGSTGPDEDSDSTNSRAPTEKITSSTVLNLSKDASASKALKPKSRSSNIGVSTPRRVKRSTRASYTSSRKSSTNELRFLNLWGLDKAPHTISSTRSRKSDPYSHLTEYINQISTPTSSSERNARIQRALEET